MRARWIPVLVLLLVASTAGAVRAEGLYVGHGYRSVDFAWNWRLNAALGVHGAEDPWDGLAGDTRYPVGWSGELGLERALSPSMGLEVHGALRGLDSTEDFLVLEPGDWTGRPGRYRYELDATEIGVTLRVYRGRADRKFHFGGGFGWISADAEYREVVAGGNRFATADDGSGPELHFVGGVDGAFSPSLWMALEVGLRITDIDYDRPVGPGGDAGQFTGAFATLRLSWSD